MVALLRYRPISHAIAWGAIETDSAAGVVNRPRSTLLLAFSLPRRMGLQRNCRVPAHYPQAGGDHPGYAQHPYRWPLK